MEGMQKPPGAPLAGKPASESPTSCRVIGRAWEFGAHCSHRPLLVPMQYPLPPPTQFVITVPLQSGDRSQMHTRDL